MSSKLMICALAIAIAAVFIPGAQSSVVDRKVHARRNRIPTPPAVLDKVCNAPGYYRNATDCNQYYRCVDFKGDGVYTLFKFKCGEMTVFNEHTSVCVGPEQAIPSCPADQLAALSRNQVVSGQLQEPDIRPPRPNPLAERLITVTEQTVITVTQVEAVGANGVTSTVASNVQIPDELKNVWVSGVERPAQITKTTCLVKVFQPTYSTVTSLVTPTPPPPSTSIAPTTVITVKPTSLVTSMTFITRPPRPRPSSSVTESVTKPTPPLTSSPALSPPQSSIAFPEDTAGKSRTIYIRGSTTYAVFIPTTAVQDNAKCAKAGEPIKLDITTTLARTLNSVTTIYGQNVGIGLEPSGPMLEGEGTVLTRTMNIEQGATVLTEAQLIQPTVSQQQGSLATLYSTVLVTRTLASTLLTTVTRPTTMFINNQEVTTTVLQTLTLRPVAPGCTYNLRPDATVISGTPVTRTITELYTPVPTIQPSIKPDPVVSSSTTTIFRPAITTTILEPSTFYVDGKLVTETVVRSLTLQASDIMTPTITPSTVASTVTLTYLTPTVIESNGKMITTTLYRSVLLRPYRASLATVVRPKTVTVSGQVLTTTEVQTLTLGPSTGVVTSVIRPTSTFLNGVMMTTSAVDTYLIQPEDVDIVGSNTLEVEGSTVGTAAGNLTRVDVDPNSKLESSMMIAPDQIQPGNTVYFAYTKWLTLRPRASTIYRTLTMTQNGAPVTVTVMTTTQPPVIVSSIIETTSAIAGMNGELLVGSQTVAFPPPPTPTVPVTPTPTIPPIITTIVQPGTFTFNGQLVTENVLETVTLQASDIRAATLEPSMTESPITMTYLNPAVVQSLGQLITTTLYKTVVLRPYRPTIATLYRSKTMFVSGQVQTTRVLETITLPPAGGLVTSIIKPTSAMVNGMVVPTSVTQTYFMEQENLLEGGENLYEVAGSQMGDVVPSITRLQIDNAGVVQGELIAPEQVRPGNRLVLTYTQWFSLIGRVSTIYRPVTVTENGVPVTITALQTVTPTPVITTALLLTTVDVGQQGEVMLGNETFVIHHPEPEIQYETLTEINTVTSTVSGTEVVEIVTSYIVVPITQTVVIEPVVTITLPGGTVTDTVTYTLTDSLGQVVTPTSTLQGSMSTVGVENSAFTRPTPPLSSSFGAEQQVEIGNLALGSTRGQRNEPLDFTALDQRATQVDKHGSHLITEHVADPYSNRHDDIPYQYADNMDAYLANLY